MSATRRCWPIRVTYVGELGWELHVPAEYALGVYDDLMAAGGDLGFRPVGLSAMSSLRLEKGYRDMGVDIDNTDNPLEAGLGFAVAWDKPGGFIGRDALLKARAEGPPRNRVVGLLVDDPAVDLFGNEPVLLDGEWAGYIRAAAFGYTVGGPVGLAQVTYRGRRHRPMAERRRFPGAHAGGDVAGPAADRPVLRPAAAAHPGPLRRTGRVASLAARRSGSAPGTGRYPAAAWAGVARRHPVTGLRSGPAAGPQGNGQQARGSPWPSRSRVPRTTPAAGRAARRET